MIVLLLRLTYFTQRDTLRSIHVVKLLFGTDDRISGPGVALNLQLLIFKQGSLKKLQVAQGPCAWSVAGHFSVLLYKETTFAWGGGGGDGHNLPVGEVKKKSGKGNASGTSSVLPKCGLGELSV